MQTLALLSAHVLLASGLAAAPQQETPPPPSAHYALAYRASARDTDWHVTLDARDLPREGEPIVVSLANWGEWTEVDSYHLRWLEADPPLARMEGRRDAWTVVRPPDWNGALHVEYAIATAEAGSSARAAHGLLPYRGPAYTFGFSTNTLIKISGDGIAAPLATTITIEAPQGWTIATGFGGVSRDRQEASIPAGCDNTVISMGTPVGISTSTEAAAPIEIVQWGGSTDVTAELARFAATFVDTCRASIGSPPAGTIRLVVTEPGEGGTRVDGSIAIGCPRITDGRFDPYTVHFLAHEIFHDWLGGRLQGPDESMAWFWEGFTEYFSLYYATKAELVPRDWFPRRLLDYEEAMAENEHWGKLAFADPSVQWRDPAIEPLAYHGSAMVGFALDVALREDGREGLVELLRGLLALPNGRYDLDAIRTWLEASGQGAFWAERLAKPNPPDLRKCLEAIGVFVRGTPPAVEGIEIDPPGMDAFLR